MPEPVQLETAHYARRRRRRSCLGTFSLLFLAFFGLLFASRVVSMAGSTTPVFGDAVGVVRIEGPINESRKIVPILKQMRESTRIKAIVLRLDTPGGSVGASEEIYREVLRIRTEKKKPVVASMGNAAASGGYYVAAAADEIFANSGTITGSIGVIAPGFNVRETMEKLGIRPAVIKSGEHKDTGSPYQEMTPEERNLLQGLIFDAYRQFVQVVLRGRHQKIAEILRNRPEAFDQVVAAQSTKRPGAGLEWEAFTTGTVANAVGATTETETALRRIADGRVLTGDQALQVGLVDTIGGLEDAIKRAATLGGISGEPAVVEREPQSEIPAWLGGAARQAWEAFVYEGPRIEYRH